MITRVVTIFTMSPMSVIKLGASHMGVFNTSQFQKGWRYESIKLRLSHLYVCSPSFLSWTGNNILSLVNENMVMILEYLFCMNSLQRNDYVLCKIQRLLLKNASFCKYKIELTSVSHVIAQYLLPIRDEQKIKMYLMLFFFFVIFIYYIGNWGVKKIIK